MTFSDTEVYYRYVATDGSVVIVDNLGAVPLEARDSVTRTELPADGRAPLPTGSGNGTFSMIAGPQSTAKPGTGSVASLSWALAALVIGSVLLFGVMWALLRRHRRVALALVVLIVALATAAGTYVVTQRSAGRSILPTLTLPTSSTVLPSTGLADVPRGAAEATRAMQDKRAILDAIEASEQNSRR